MLCSGQRFASDDASALRKDELSLEFVAFPLVDEPIHTKLRVYQRVPRKTSAEVPEFHIRKMLVMTDGSCEWPIVYPGHEVL